MSREQPRSAAALLAGPLELVPDQNGALQGSRRGSSFEVDPESGRLRVRAAVGFLSARLVERSGREPKLETDPDEPLFAEALLDCLDGSEVHAWLSQPGSRLQVGWLEQPLPDDLDQARKAIDGLVRLAPELARRVKDAEVLARKRSVAEVKEEEPRWLYAQSVAEEQRVDRVAERKRFARSLGQGTAAAGLVICVGALLMVMSGHLAFEGAQPSFILGLLALVGGQGVARLVDRSR